MDGSPGRHAVKEEGFELMVAYAQATEQAERFALVELIQRNMHEEVFSIYPAQGRPQEPLGQGDPLLRDRPARALGQAVG